MPCGTSPFLAAQLACQPAPYNQGHKTIWFHEVVNKEKPTSLCSHSQATRENQTLLSLTISYLLMRLVLEPSSQQSINIRNTILKGPWDGIPQLCLSLDTGPDSDGTSQKATPLVPGGTLRGRLEIACGRNIHIRHVSIFLEGGSTLKFIACSSNNVLTICRRFEELGPYCSRSSRAQGMFYFEEKATWSAHKHIFSHLV